MCQPRESYFDRFDFVGFEAGFGVEEFESADKNHDNKLVPTEIAASLSEIVPQLVERLQKAGLIGKNERQNPVWFIPKMENLFPLAGQN